MRIDEFEFQDRNGNEIEPTKNQLVVYVKSLHKQIAELEKQLAEKDKYTYTGKEVGEIERKYETQLAEKEKELLIERTTNDNWYKREVYIRDEKIKMLINRQNQKAISELEKLKNFFLEPYRDEEMDTDFLITKDAGNIADYVLDRIKELKGEK